MKIIIFSDNVAPYRMAWANELGKSNDVTFVYVKDKDAERNDAWLVKQSDYCKMVKLPALIVRNKAVTLNFVKYIKKNPADLIIFDGYGILQNAFAMLYMNAHKKKYLVNVDGIHMGAKENGFKKALKKILFTSYSYFTCGSEYTKKWLTSMGVDASHITVHNFSSIHESEILSSPPSEEEKRKKKEELHLKDFPTVLAVGRFLDWKQFDLLIKAFVPLDDKAQLLIIGEGGEKQKYEEIIKEERLKNVRIIDFMDYQKLKNYFLVGNLLVLPSYGEVWGLVVNEAMCHALPVITSDSCIAGEALIEDGINGYKFKNPQVDDLRAKMEKILFDQNLQQTMAINNLAKIHDYTIEHTAKVHLEFLKHWN